MRSAGTDAPASDKSKYARRSRDAAICLLLGLISLVIYNANLRSIPAGDTFPARYLPFAIWNSHTVVLDSLASTVAQGRRLPGSPWRGGERAFWVTEGRNGHLVSFYPIVVPVVVAPLYLPAIAYLDKRGWDPPRLDNVARIMEKICASLIAAATVMLMYLLLLRRRSEPGLAAALTLVFAFGTTTWVISSQALWMHGLAQLLIVAALLLLTGPRSAPRVIAVGFLLALVACNRQPDAILAAGLGLYALWWAGRMSPLLVAAGAAPVGVVVAYNLEVVGHIAGAYASVAHAPDFVSGEVLSGLAGLLVSPMKGLFVFSPFLLFLVFCAPVFRDRNTRVLAVAISAAVVLQVAFYAMLDWRQGISWGPRWLTDMLPMLFWMLPPIVLALPAVGRIAFGFACAVAIAIQGIGAFWYIGVADAALAAAQGPDKMRAAWDVRNAPFIAELGHPPVRGDLVFDLRGNIDLVTMVEKNDAGQQKLQLDIHGWALANGRSPVDVAVRIDHRLRAGTSEFFTRPDVVRTLGMSSPSGWRITFPADDLAPGEHLVSALVRASERGEPRLLKEHTFTVAKESDRRDEELAQAARRAARRLAGSQQTPGYWLTAFTDDARYEHPRPEMNTFVNAMMLDLAGPIAEAAGIAGNMGRARDFLASQIEAGGLVRYHGRPDAPTIGVLGCAITPDADDTVLVWRVAPGQARELLATALATLDQFRRADGFYRTWLAPRERYECIDPGKDPNPADIAIQMHVLMLLTQSDPTAARALCEALRRGLAEESNWVYYRKAPLVPLLRLDDMRSVGCPLELPEPRTQTEVSGQEMWIEAARHLQAIESGENTYRATADLLRKIAANDFSFLAHTPPLLYHNDLTASVRRFYWSEDLGYALWLRLYFGNERAKSNCDVADAKPC